MRARRAPPAVGISPLKLCPRQVGKGTGAAPPLPGSIATAPTASTITRLHRPLSGSMTCVLAARLTTWEGDPTDGTPSANPTLFRAAWPGVLRWRGDAAA